MFTRLEEIGTGNVLLDDQMLFTFLQSYTIRGIMGHLHVSDEDVAICNELYGKVPPADSSNEFLELICYLRPGIQKPRTVNGAIELYASLIYDIDNIWSS